MKALVGSEYADVVIPLIDAAKRDIALVTYDWRWYSNDPGHVVQKFNAALVRAVQRGVQVRAVLNTDLILPILQKVGIKAKCLKENRVIHAKVLMIDEAQAVIGSHNLTSNAFFRNLEVSVLVDIPEGENRLRDFFERLYLL